MASPCWFLLLPAELRMKIYRHLFHNFTLELTPTNTLTPHKCNVNTAPNQFCKANKQIRYESIPILALCTKIITSPTLLPYKNGRLDSNFKPETITPRLHPSFFSNIEGILVSSQSASIPDPKSFPNLKRIVVDGWLYSDEPISMKLNDKDKDKVKDKDLVRMVKADMARRGVPEDVYPRWLEDLAAGQKVQKTTKKETGKEDGEESANVKTKPKLKVKLALRQVWLVDENESETSFLVSPNLSFYCSQRRAPRTNTCLKSESSRQHHR
jgi:hypothetical protein